MKSPADQLRDALEQSGLTQQEIAHAAEIGQSIVSSFLRGNGISTATFFALDKFAKETGLFNA